jgi:hypothetical protein
MRDIIEIKEIGTITQNKYIYLFEASYSSN